MNNEEGKIWYGLGIDNTGLQADANKSTAIFRGIGTQAASDCAKMDRGFNALGVTVASALSGAAIVSFGKQLIDVTGKFQTYRAVLNNTLGDPLKAGNAMEMVQDFAASTPFQVDALIGSFVKLANQGFVPTIQQMTLLGDLASSTGKGFDQLTEAVIDAQVGEFERLKEFGIRASKEGDNVTFTFKEQQTQVDFTASSIRDYILSLGELEGVQGANAAIAATFTGQVSNLQDSITQMMNNIGQSSSGALSGAISGAAFLVDHYEEVGKILGVLIATYGTYKASILAYVAVQRIAGTASNIKAFFQLAKAIKSAKDAQILLNMATSANPYVLLATAVVAVGTALWAMAGDAKSAKEEFDDLKTELDGVASEFEELDKKATGAKKLADRYDELKTKTSLTKDETIELNSILNTLSTAYPDIISRVNDYGDAIDINTGKLNKAIESERKLLLIKNQDIIDDTLESAGNVYNNYKDSTRSAAQSRNHEKSIQGSIKSTALFPSRQKALKGYLAETKNETIGYQAQAQDNLDIFYAYTQELMRLGLTSEEIAQRINKEAKVELKGSDIDAIRKQYQAEEEIVEAGGDKDKKGDKGGDNTPDPNKLHLDAQKKANEESIALERSRIEDKATLLAFDYDQTVKAIQKEQDAYVEAGGTDVAVFNARKQTALDAYLDKLGEYYEKQDAIAEKNSAEEEKKRKEEEAKTKEYLSGLYAEYATYEERKEAIRKKYQKEREILQADGASQEVIDNLNNSEAAEIQSVDNEAFDSLKSGANIIAQVFDDTAKRTNKQINTLRTRTEELMAYLANTNDADITAGFGMSAEQLKTLKASPDQLKAISDALDELYDKGSKQNPFAQLATDAKNLFSKGGFDMSNIEDFSSSLNSVTGMITNVTGGLKEMFEASGNEKGAAIVGGIEEGLSAVSNIASGFAQGGIVGGAMAAVGELINGFTKGAQVEAEHQAKLEEIRKSNIAQQEAYNQLLREQNLLYEDGNNLLSKDAYGTATNAIAQAKKDAVTLKADIAKLGQVDIETGSYTTGALWWKKQHTTYTDLLKLYPDLIDANGQLDKEMAQTILDTRGMSDAHRQLLEDAIESQEAFEESIGVMRDYLEDTFGDMGNQLSDSLVDAFKNGEDAAEAFGNTVNSMIENMVSDLVYSMVFADLFNNASKEIARVQTGFNEDGTANEYANMSDEEKLTAQMGILSGLMGGVEGKMSEAEQLLEWAKQEGQNQGLDGFMESTEERQGSSKGIATASQESVDENNGRLTAIQGHTYGIFESVKVSETNQSAIRSSVEMMYSRTGEILDCLYDIKDNTEYCRRLDGMDKDITSIRKGIDSLNKGITLKR